jgi:hypothetical protein
MALLPADVAQGLQLVGRIKDQKAERKEGSFSSDVWLLTHPDYRGNARVRACMQFLTDRLSV